MMDNNFLTRSQFSLRLVAVLVIVLMQLPAVTPALGFGRTIQSGIVPTVSGSSSFSPATGPLTVFSNTTAFTVADATAGGPGVAGLYPSPIVVTGLVGTVSDVNVTLSGITSSRARDIDVLLVSPTGQTLVLWGDAGGVCAMAAVTVTFDDAAAGQLPNLISDPCPPGTPITTGTYKPTNGVPTVGEVDVFPPPAPAGPYNVPAPAGAATLATAFNGIAPNGTWNLYVVDDQLGGGTHTFAGGWSIDITAVGGIDPTTTSVVSNTNPALTTQPITFTSTTTNNTTASPATAGTVTFTNNGVTIAGCLSVPVNGSGQATCMTTLAEGTRTIAANYSGTATLGASSGSVTQVVNSPTVVSGAQFCNNGGFTITDGSTSAPVYPSSITVGGLFGTVSTVTAQINGLTAPRTNNLDLLLVGPGGQAFQMMSDTGDAVTPVAGINLTLADSAGGQLPIGTPLSSGTFRPTDSPVAGDSDPYPAPAPAVFLRAAPAGASTFTSVFGTTAPNGTWQLFAVDDGIGGGNSTVVSWCVNFTVTPFATTTTVTSSADPSVFGQPVTFTATVSSGGGTPTGDVEFFDGATSLGIVALNGSGQAALTTSALSVGSHTITAQYAGASVGAGGGGFASSNGSMTGNPQVVNQASTTTAVSSSSNPVGTGIPVTFTVTVSPVAPGSGTRTGTVTVFRNGVAICSNVAINASGQATCMMTFTIAANYNITAQYSGDTNFTASTSPTLVQQAVGPTAANVSVSGRVLDAEGRGVYGAHVAMQNQEGVIVRAITNPFGYYRFANVPAGQSYLVSVEHKRFEFQPRTVNVTDDLSGLDFIEEPASLSNETGNQPPGRRP